MDGVVEADPSGPARVVARDLDSVLPRFGAGADEQRLPLFRQGTIWFGGSASATCGSYIMGSMQGCR